MGVKILIVLAAAAAAVMVLVRHALRYQQFVLLRWQCQALIKKKLHEHQAVVEGLEKAKAEMEKSTRPRGQPAPPRV